jgi:hypothetical protein
LPRNTTGNAGKVNQAACSQADVVVPCDALGFGPSSSHPALRLPSNSAAILPPTSQRAASAASTSARANAVSATLLSSYRNLWRPPDTAGEGNVVLWRAAVQTKVVVQTDGEERQAGLSAVESNCHGFPLHATISRLSIMRDLS